MKSECAARSVESRRQTEFYESWASRIKVCPPRPTHEGLNCTLFRRRQFGYLLPFRKQEWVYVGQTDYQRLRTTRHHWRQS